MIKMIDEILNGKDKPNEIYSKMMIVVILISIIPLLFKGDNLLFRTIDMVTVSIFILDYIARWTMVYFNTEKGERLKNMLKYPFTFFAVVDLLSILPALYLINGGFKLFRLFRLFRVVRVLRILRHSKSFNTLTYVIELEKTALMSTIYFVMSYIFVAALVMFSAEPKTFDNFFEALYWAATALATVGYGDIFPVTAVGRLVSMVSALVGIAVIALPTGIITAGYVETLRTIKREEEKEENRRSDF